MEAEILVVLCTFPEEALARQIGAVLVEKQVAACVSVLPGLRSIYAWGGKLHEEAEVLAVIKTTSKAYRGLEQELLAHHPYENPEILALPAAAGAAAYLKWVEGQTASGSTVIPGASSSDSV